MKKRAILVFVLLLSFSLTACSGKNNVMPANTDAGQNSRADNASSKQADSRIKLKFNNAEVIVKMYDNPTSRDFLTLLPLTIKVEDYAGREKIAYLPKKLSLDAAPAGMEPKAGDFTYFAPWGNVALFYHEYGYSNGLISLGKIESGLEKLTDSGAATIRMEKIE
ncbi:cyclophilin-like fold protein [Azotosporobacter soli]|uniref:cyclophilin-like fold protein n=1 Tax=Azotosporobacter soli TaxID=3055040 RepID=UPI0031FE6180